MQHGAGVLVVQSRLSGASNLRGGLNHRFYGALNAQDEAEGLWRAELCTQKVYNYEVSRATFARSTVVVAVG